MTTNRKCKKCGETKDLLADFESAKRSREGRMPVCKTCRAEYRSFLKARPKVQVISKVCTVCHSTKEISAFTNQSQSPDGKSPQCKSCRALVRQQVDPAKNRERFLNWKYGIGDAEYQRMLEKQAGVCAICARPQLTHRKYLDIDHCHSTGKVRGLLCSNCNRGLGYLQDDPTRILRLAQYALRSLAQDQEDVLKKERAALLAEQSRLQAAIAEARSEAQKLGLYD